jgi:hypothetical protein
VKTLEERLRAALALEHRDYTMRISLGPGSALLATFSSDGDELARYLVDGDSMHCIWHCADRKATTCPREHSGKAS